MKEISNIYLKDSLTLHEFMTQTINVINDLIDNQKEIYYELDSKANLSDLNAKFSELDNKLVSNIYSLTSNIQYIEDNYKKK